MNPINLTPFSLSSPNSPSRRRSGARQWLPLLAGAVLAVAMQTSAFAQSQLINFYADPSKATPVSGAAVLGNSGDLWNGVTNVNGSVANAVDSLGNSTTISLSMSGLGQSDAAVVYGQTSATALLENSYWNLQWFSQGAFTVTLTGLTANTDYELISYMTGEGANSGGTATWLDGTGTTITGSTHCTANSQEASFSQGVNYALLTGESDSSGKIVYTVSQDPSGDAAWAWNGLQLELAPVPEPSTIALGVMGALALLFRRRKCGSAS
jgi:hypothetical protein